MNEHYLCEIQYLGFRYHGWLKQPSLPTIQQTIETVIEKLFPHQKFQTLGASRTDSMVSAEQNYFLLMIEAVVDSPQIMTEINQLLPLDIRLVSIKKVSRDFRIIGAAKMKEYHYHFIFGERPHPFSAPNLVHFSEELDIEIMKEAARLFVGSHSFHNFVHQDRRDQFVKSIDHVTIDWQGDHWVFNIRGASFMRHQVRLMMGALLKVGTQQMSILDLKKLLDPNQQNRQTLLVPATGLVLQRLEIVAT